MANLSEDAVWIDGIYQIERNDPVGGGKNGVVNKPHADLASRTKYLKENLEILAAHVNEGYINVSSFEKGANLTLANEILLWESDGQYYKWTGDLPKSVPANSTPSNSGGVGAGKWSPVGDASLRHEFVEFKDDISLNGDKIVSSAYGGSVYSDYKQSEFIKFGVFSAGAIITHNRHAMCHEGLWYVRKVQINSDVVVTPGSQPDDDWRCVGFLNGYDIDDVRNFGALDGVDSSDAARLMLASTGFLYVKKDFTLIAKNIELNNNDKVYIEGIIKLHDDCEDFDRLFFGHEKQNIIIEINEMDGNYNGQHGNIGTHLIYFTNSTNIDIEIKYVHDHYCTAFINSPDGIRNASSGCVFIAHSTSCKCVIETMRRWGREGLYLCNCTRSTAAVGYALGTGGVDGDWSGVQVSGKYNKLLHAHVENAGATNIGFDTQYGTAGKLVSINSRYFNGVNFGHAGSPSSHSTVESIIVDGCGMDGISINADTKHLIINSFTVKNSARYGINQTNGANHSQLQNGVIINSHIAQIRISESALQLGNVTASDIAESYIDIDDLQGEFTTGDIITGATSAATAKVTYAYYDERGAGTYYKYLTLQSLNGEFTDGEIVSTQETTASARIVRKGKAAIVSKYGTVEEIFRGCKLSSDPLFGYESMAGKRSTTVYNGNVRSSSVPIVQPTNPISAKENFFVKTVADGYFIVETGTGNVTDGGAGFRYTIL